MVWSSAGGELVVTVVEERDVTESVHLWPTGKCANILVSFCGSLVRFSRWSDWIFVHISSDSLPRGITHGM